MELEIGSGGSRGQGVSTDLCFFPTLSVQCAGYALPFREGVFSKVFMNGAFEHFTYPQAKDVLKESFRVLASGGLLDLNAPDLLAFAELLVSVVKSGVWPRTWEAPDQGLKETGVKALDYILSGFYGGQDRQGMVHQSGWTDTMLQAALSQVGFTEVDLYSRDHNEPGTHLSFRAKKP